MIDSGIIRLGDSIEQSYVIVSDLVYVLSKMGLDRVIAIYKWFHERERHFTKE